MREQYTVGKAPMQWSETAQTITFIVTEDCNLRCKYCYITHKSSNRKMGFSTAKKFIDYVLTADIQISEDVIVEFFGGEPMIEMKLVDQISDYFKIRAYELNHPWAWRYRFNFATNGVNYSSPEVQAYIEKNYGKVSIGISIDGTKEKHDLNRVFPDGSGSYSAIEKNIPLWLSQFAPSTKMTFASADLKYLKDSVIDLWNHGVTEVSANVVFEDVWQEGDDVLFEQQLRELADYILDNQLFDKYYCTFFSDSIGGYQPEEMKDSTYCGAGKMIALAPNGNIYPCVRYKDYSLNKHPERVIGTVDTGIDMELVRPFMVAASRYQDDSECANCPIASGCPQCQGFSYDEADTCTNFQRAKFICKMQKARVRANEYYFAKLFNRYGIRRQGARDTTKMYFLLSDAFPSYCCFHNQDSGNGAAMTINSLKAGLKFCSDNFFTPVLVHADDRFLAIDFSQDFEEYYLQHVIPVHLWEKATCAKDVLFVFDHETIRMYPHHLSNCIYNIEQANLDFLATDVIALFETAERINVNILDLDGKFDEACYLAQLRKIKDYLVSCWADGIQNRELNLITDLCNTEGWCNCGAGNRSFVLAPNGKIYTCPGFYKEYPETFVGDAENGIDNLKNPHLYCQDYHPICQVCDAKQCRICIYRNIKGTREVNVSPSYQCRKSHLERKVSAEYLDEICATGRSGNTIAPVDYLDPAVLTPTIKKKEIGYYKMQEDELHEYSLL